MADCNRTDNTELQKPQQATDPGINASDRRLDALTVGTLVSQSRQKKSPEPFSTVEEEKYEPYEVGGGTSEIYPQKESQVAVDSLNSKIDALNKELDKLRLQKDCEVKHLKDELAANERRAEHAKLQAYRAEQRAHCAEQRAHHAELQLRQQKRNYQIERSASMNEIQELRGKVNKLQIELNEAQENFQLEKCIKEETQEKIAALQIRVNELELEKEAPNPLMELNLYCKDVEPTTEQKQLGRGCYGSVVEVIYKGNICAAKKFRDDLEIKKYNTELLILLQLKHKHIVCYLGYTILEGSYPALLMEKLATSLHEYLVNKSDDIPLAEKVHILLSVGKGLEYLHKSDVVHRDLTAYNVLLDESNPPLPKIADFGNSRVTSTNPIYECDSSGFPGTLLYMPPEACSHAGRRSYKLDIFSFGHLSLFVCTQTFPCNLLPEKYVHTHEGGRKERCVPSEVERREEYFRMIYDEQYRLLRLLMRKCLDDFPDERPSAGEVVCELEKIRVSQNLSDDVDCPDYGNAPAKNEYQFQGSDNSSLGIR